MHREIHSPRRFHTSLIGVKGPITTMKPLADGAVTGAGLVAFDHKEFCQRDYGRLSMGLKPSGELHMGTIATILNGMLYLEGHRGASLRIDVMDLDYDTQRGLSFPSFMTMRDPKGCHSLMKHHTKEKVERTVQKLSAILGIDPKRVEVSFYTENYACEGFPELMTSLIRQRVRAKAVKHALFDGKGGTYDVPFTPICPECGYSSSSNSTYDSKADTLRTKCKNKECGGHGKVFSVPVSDLLAYNVYYLIDPIRDVHESANCPRADVHLFGGDYLLTHGVKRKSRVQRVADAMTAVTSRLPDFFIGPMLTLNSMKMSKSLGAEAADESVSGHIYTRLAEVLKANASPAIEIWNIIVR